MHENVVKLGRKLSKSGFQEEIHAEKWFIVDKNVQWRGKDTRKCRKVREKTIKKWFLGGNLRRKVVYRRQKRVMMEKEYTKLS